MKKKGLIFLVFPSFSVSLDGALLFYSVSFFRGEGGR